jgi:predicted transcriptional regulator
MIDFACKRFDLNQIIKCGLGLTKSEFEVFQYFLKYSEKDLQTIVISKALKLNLTTVQKATKKLYEAGVIQRQQKNISGGGYLYCYKVRDRNVIRQILKDIIQNWTKNVEKGIDNW